MPSFYDQIKNIRDSYNKKLAEDGGDGVDNYALDELFYGLLEDLDTAVKANAVIKKLKS